MKTTARLAALLALMALVARADDPDPEPPGGMTAELKKLTGTWTVVRALMGKRELKAPPGMSFTFEGDKLTRHMPLGKGANVKGKQDVKMTYKVKIDTKTRPYTIEMIPQGATKGTTGIFKIEQGELFLVTGRPKDGTRPKDFSGDGGPVLVLTREKGKK